jgi:hypothetical protein
MGGSSEQLHSLAEDVKLSAHGRHPIAYPLCFRLFFNFLFFFFFKFLLFVFQYYFSIVFFKDKGYFSSSLGVCYEPCQSRQFSISLGQLFPCYLHIGDNMYFKFESMVDTLHTLCP